MKPVVSAMSAWSWYVGPPFMLDPYTRRRRASAFIPTSSVFDEVGGDENGKERGDHECCGSCG